ncbi:MAG: hypothetical protein ACD_44C00225G0007 [uncultured bacterium]|nr:MAG: hypothetical protein ACD_44C00225G0007 [uncultured bacterium]OGT16067.1 MAG: hypothetical protein A3B69_00530 [Gammaproteobacteria bacterium RIFCSPHIGHO2_02_FULL_38_33]OGT24633.1 MAG: hypothetical protein A2W47_06105 [Gammaproteobacteria bacterium RIFCSPHIGHO2_12_38_15]OGT67428.1 MAG: hypothetical protein A3I12_04015 [Gammaproteobacteria bacterium RIFCSPLOWO2_02_FULL_38_11]OGT77774.1 MAG: hypothetical protein A3G71_06005 [Gammaproteobacteria bacterium RIFCSPLOWO2_12_FULL_38_14]
MARIAKKIFIFVLSAGVLSGSVVAQEDDLVSPAQVYQTEIDEKKNAAIQERTEEIEKNTEKARKKAKENMLREQQRSLPSSSPTPNKPWENTNNPWANRPNPWTKSSPSSADNANVASTTPADQDSGDVVSDALGDEKPTMGNASQKQNNTSVPTNIYAPGGVSAGSATPSNVYH